MIDKVSYEDMISYSKELQASANAISELMQNKDLKELEKFVKEVNSYSEFLATLSDKIILDKNKYNINSYN